MRGVLSVVAVDNITVPVGVALLPRVAEVLVRGGRSVSRLSTSLRTRRRQWRRRVCGLLRGEALVMWKSQGSRRQR